MAVKEGIGLTSDVVKEAIEANAPLINGTQSGYEPGADPELGAEICRLKKSVCVSESIDKLINDLMLGKVKLHNLSTDKQLKVAKALKEKAPLKTEGDVNINIRVKNGYDDIQYKWSSQGYDYEMRWHTATPNAPVGTPPQLES